MTASPLIFHRNVAWYCCEYHERNTINLSLFIQQMIQNSRRDISSRRLFAVSFTVQTAVRWHRKQLRQLCVFACTGVSHGARVAAASMVLEECLSKIPPVRKDPQSVQTFLLELAAELEQ